LFYCLRFPGEPLKYFLRLPANNPLPFYHVYNGYVPPLLKSRYKGGS
jgi:hypothetical protein